MIHLTLYPYPKWMCQGWVQNVIISCIVFCCPGFFNALGGLGGAGSGKADIATATNAALYGAFSIFGYFGGFFFNVIGPQLLIVCGGLTYGFYAFGQYLPGVAEGTEWLAILSGAVLGIGAGIFWTAQGAITMGYATNDLLGTYTAVFWTIFNLGGVTGGLIGFGLNYTNVNDTANPAMYFVFIGIMCFGALMGLVLIVPPHKVTRSDGSEVTFDSDAGACDELKLTSTVILRKEMLLLSLLFFQSNFFYAYEFGGVNLPIFTIRARSLNSAMYWGAQMLGAGVFGRFIMDNTALGGPRRRALIGAIGSFTVVAITWVMAIILTYVIEGGYEGKKTAGGFGFCYTCADGAVFDPDCKAPAACCPNTCIDIDDSARYVYPILTFILMGIGDAVIQCFSYWMMGAIAGEDTALVARFAGFYKGIQSLGGCISWAIDRPEVTYRLQLWINIGLFTVAIPPTIYACLLVPETSEKAAESGDSELEEGKEQPSVDKFEVADPVPEAAGA